MDDGPRFYGSLKDFSDGQGKPVLVFNHLGRIDPIILPDFDQLFYQGPVYPEKVIPFEHLANACIVFQVAKSIGVTPGLFECGDRALRKELLFRLSNRFSDKETEVKLLLESWKVVATHPIAQPFVQLFRAQSPFYRPFGFPMVNFGSFELFIQYYMMGLSKIIAYTPKQYLDQFVKGMLLVEANFRGHWYLLNQYVSWPILKKYTENLLVELGEDAKVKSLHQLVMEKCEFQKRMWFAENKIIIELTIDDLHEDFADHLEDLCMVLYFFCCNKDFTDLDGVIFKKNPRLCAKLFDDLTHPQLLLSNPRYKPESCEKTYDDQLMTRDPGSRPSHKDIKEAIIWTCYQYGLREGVFCFHDSREKFPWQRIGLSLEGDEAFLKEGIDFKEMKNFQLYHFAQSSRYEPLKEELMLQLRDRCEMGELCSGFGRMGIGSNMIVSRRGLMPGYYLGAANLSIGLIGLQCMSMPSYQRFLRSRAVQEVPVLEDVHEAPHENSELVQKDSLAEKEVVVVEDTGRPLEDDGEIQQAASSSGSSSSQGASQPSVPSMLWMPQFRQLDRALRGEDNLRQGLHRELLEKIDEAINLVDTQKSAKSRSWFGFF